MTIITKKFVIDCSTVMNDNRFIDIDFIDCSGSRISLSGDTAFSDRTCPGDNDNDNDNGNNNELYSSVM